MAEAALTLARAIGYESAGTVEFLVDDETRDFYFLEVNARLQVEHPVSEEVSGIDIVREQLRLAQGEKLGYDQEDIRLRGHSIEVRLCAEDPLVGFLPATGELVAFEPATEPSLRWESGVERGSVSPSPSTHFWRRSSPTAPRVTWRPPHSRSASSDFTWAA